MNVLNDICAYCADGGHCEWWCRGKSFQTSKRVKEALEKQEKYKWHDLRKNPDDTPAGCRNVLIALDSLCVGCGWIFEGNWFGIWDDLEDVVGIKKEWVIAWREIEPFDGGDTE